MTTDTGDNLHHPMLSSHKSRNPAGILRLYSSVTPSTQTTAVHYKPAVEKGERLTISSNNSGQVAPTKTKSNFLVMFSQLAPFTSNAAQLMEHTLRYQCQSSTVLNRYTRSNPTLPSSQGVQMNDCTTTSDNRKYRHGHLDLSRSEGELGSSPKRFSIWMQGRANTFSLGCVSTLLWCFVIFFSIFHEL